MVKDILGLRTEDDFSQLKHERLKAKCDENMITEDREESTLEVETNNDLTRNRKHHHTSTSRLRQCFTMQEVKKLERFFEDTIGYPDTKTRRKLATEMQVSESKIQIWFQNRRAKFRRQKRQQTRQQNLVKYDFNRTHPFNFIPRLNVMSHVNLMNQLQLINIYGKRPLMQYEIYDSLRQNELQKIYYAQRTK